jgi:uncharacterized protein (TIGR02145 family)
MKPLITTIALLLTLFLNTGIGYSQQQIIQGQRLPRLTSEQRDKIETAGNILAGGQVIFNTDINCLEYWNGKRWVSLCEGNSHLTIKPEPCPIVNAEGTDCNREYEVFDPDCGNGPFSFVIVAGSEFANLTDVNQADGKFQISFNVNNSINQRSAVVRVTSSCTGLYKDFIFMQDGQVCTYVAGDAPEINVVSRPVDLCGGGAVYLSVPFNTSNLRDLIWTRNNVEVARGVNQITVTQAGVYDVHLGFVGCGKTTDNSVNVTRGATVAPQPVSIIVGVNNGLVCKDTETTQLFATATSSGTIVWYKNGARTEHTGSPVKADIGTWFAVVEDGLCFSSASNTVSVMLDPNHGTAIPTPEFTVNEKLPSSNISICTGGSLRLAVDNYNPALTYSWYLNNTMIGSGKNFEYSIAGITSDFILQLRATGGSCSSAGVSEITITGIPAPQTPFLTTNPASGALCDGTSTLIANPANAEEYIWYRNGDMMDKTDVNALVIDALGDYSVKAMTDGCVSDISNTRPVNVASAYNAMVDITGSELGIEIGTVRSFTAVMDNPQGAVYTWGVTDGAVLLSAPGTNPATVRFDSKPAGITLTASNVCGAATVRNADVYASINVGEECHKPTNIAYTPAIKSATVTAGNSATLSLNPSGGTAPYHYTWYERLGATAEPLTDRRVTQPSTLNTYSLPSTTAVGEYFYYAVITNCRETNSTISDPFRVAVNSNPSILPTGSLGRLSGRNCFDIAISNNDAFGCGSLTNRETMRADFTLSSVNTQTYTFTPDKTVSNVRFMYVENQTGMIVESIIPFSNYGGNNISTACRVSITYKSNINETAKGLSNFNRLMVDLYAIYNDKADGTGEDQTARLTITIKDCACCGNNGDAAPQQIGNNDYLTHVYMTGGSTGNVARCWMVENSREGTPTYTTYTNKTPGERGYYYKWPVAKTACPNGWSMPTKAEFEMLKGVLSKMNNNVVLENPRRYWNQAEQIAGFVKTYNVSDILGMYWGSTGYWWSSTDAGGNSYHYLYTYPHTNSNNINTASALGTEYGFSVRCVQDN